MVAWSNAKLEFRDYDRKGVWVSIVENEFRRLEDLMGGPLRLYGDNKSPINITHNLVQHDITKHIKVDLTLH